MREVRRWWTLPAALLLAAALAGAGDDTGRPPPPGVSDRPPRDAGSRVGPPPPPRPPWTIIRLDPRLDRIVRPDAVLETVATGHRWVEGPVWDVRRAELLYSDIPANAVYRWRPAEGVELALRPSGYTGRAPFRGREPGANGLLIDGAGRLVLCQHGDRRIARLGPDGRFETLADRYAGRRLNSPNDAVLASDGTILFTDPPFGLPDAFSDPARELEFSGVYRLFPDGSLELLTDALEAPNGIALSPSGDVLYVSNASRDRPVIVSFRLPEEGPPGEAEVLFDATPWLRPDRGVPDGIEVDREGNLYVAGPAGVHVLAPDGAHLGIIDPGATTSNVAWGEDGSTLFITADHDVHRIRLEARGPGF